MKTLTAAALTARLNAAVTSAGEAAGYEVRDYTDRSCSYADYCGFAVTGPNEDRALTWIRTAVAEFNRQQQSPRSTDWNRCAVISDDRGAGVRYVAAMRYSLGE
jgi:hypothetical protein